MLSQSSAIGHLLRRAGFGAGPAEQKYYESIGYERTLESLLNPQPGADDAMEQEIARQNFDYTDPDDLRRWWIYRMSFTRRPLLEKMTLFWHGHFATGLKKVTSPYAMYVQNLLLRKHALGDFHQLLSDISRDPAMIRWLDNQQNRKGKPNEILAKSWNCLPWALAIILSRM